MKFYPSDALARKNQSYTYLVFCYCIILLDCNLICLGHHPCCKKRLSIAFLNWWHLSSSWLVPRSGICGAYLNKSRIRHIPFFPRRLVFHLELTCRRYCRMIGRIPQWFKTIYRLSWAKRVRFVATILIVWDLSFYEVLYPLQ